MEHISIPAGERHPPHNWVFADAAARLAATPVAEDVDCVALQLDTHSYWRLVSISPATWAEIGGGGGGGDKHFVYVQSPAASVWTITHGLGKYPSVLVIDSSGSEVEGGIVFVNLNTVRLEFSAAFSGTAYLN